MREEVPYNENVIGRFFTFSSALGGDARGTWVDASTFTIVLGANLEDGLIPKMNPDGTENPGGNEMLSHEVTIEVGKTTVFVKGEIATKGRSCPQDMAALGECDPFTTEYVAQGNGSALVLNGSLGRLDPPRLVRFVASDFDNADDGYDAGDELELAFDMHTNLGSLDAPGGFTKETIDGLFGFSSGLGLDYSGEWDECLDTPGPRTDRMMARIGGGNRVNVQNCRVFIITIVDPTLPAGMDPPVIGRTLAWVQPPSGSVQTGQPAGYAGLRSSSAASPFATGSIALGSDDRHSAGQPILPQLDLGRRRALILERTHAAGAPTGGAGFDGGLTARLCSLDPAPMVLEKVGGVETEGPATLDGGLVVRTGSCHGGPPLLANIPAKCGAFGARCGAAIERSDKRLAAVRPPAAPVRGQVNVSLLGEDLGSIVLCQFKPDGSAGTPRAARAPAHTSPRPRLSRLPPYSLPQRMRPVPALPPPMPARLTPTHPPASPLTRPPSPLRRLWRRPRPRRDGQRRRHSLRRAAARLPRTMVRRAGRGEGGGGGGGGGGGQRVGGGEAAPLRDGPPRPARRSRGRGSDGGERYDALAQPPPRRAAAADEAAPLGGRPALLRLVARLRLLRQPDAADVPPAGRPRRRCDRLHLWRGPRRRPRRRLGGALPPRRGDDRGRTDLGRRHRARVPAAAAAPRLLTRHRVRAVGGTRRRHLRRRCGAAGVCVLCGAVAQGAAAGVEHHRGARQRDGVRRGVPAVRPGGRRRPAVQVWGGGRDGGLAAPRAELGSAAP